MPEVSVIIPVYNVEKYLRECLDSVMAQTFTDFEAICVNDGSTDGSLAILEEYAAKDNRFKIISQVNSGQGKARNEGMKAAVGKYVDFLDSDDMLTPDALQWLYETAEKHTPDILQFAWRSFYEPGVSQDLYSDKDFFKSGEYPSPLAGAELFALLARHNDWNSSVCSRFFRTEFYRSCALKFHEGIIHEDEIFSLIADLLSQRVIRFNKPCYLRRVRQGSTMTTGMSAARHLKGYLTAHEDITAFLQTHHYSAEVENMLQRRLACLLISADKYLPENPDKELLLRIADAKQFIADAEAADERANRTFSERLLAPLRCLKENGLRYTLGRIFGRNS